MGTLFDDDDEFPGHRPIPRSFPRIDGTRITVAVGISIGAADLLPGREAEPDPPHREYVDIRDTRPAFGIGSTSAGTPFVANNSLDAANTLVIQRRHQLAEAHRRLANSTTFAMPFVLRG
jgi:hypothetical protein